MVRRASRRFFRQLSAFGAVWYELRACQRYWYNKSEERRPRSWRTFPARAILLQALVRTWSTWSGAAYSGPFREYALPFMPDSRLQFIPATTRSTTSSLKQRFCGAHLSRGRRRERKSRKHFHGG